MGDIWSDFSAALPKDRDTAWRRACLEVLRLSGLFDEAYYTARRGPTPCPLEDYLDHGWRLGLWPNPYFDPAFYLARYPDVAASGTDPLLHYASYGEAEGRQPVEWFDPAWYRAHHRVSHNEHCLAHFLRHRHDGSASPIPEFDSAWYLATYADIAAAGMDPLEHFLVRGFREGRRPSPGFDTQFYRMRYLPGHPEQNPLLHYLRHRADPCVHPALPPEQTTIAREVRRFTAPGPYFEDVQDGPAAPAAALALAFYLPQFHPTPQNDAFWGKGFTEWTNTARGLPRFANHYQPRIPRDLGHYRLDDPAVLRRQTAMAAGAGLGGFVFYYYRFGSERLLAAPLEAFLADPGNDFPFCLMWANENWTRRWDGAADQVLIAQSHDPADEPPLIADFTRHFADPRYIRLGGRPLLMIYRASEIADCAATMARWRDIFANLHGENPILVMAQSFDDRDPAGFGMDAALEFPPHGLVQGLDLINYRLEVLDHEITAQVYAYDEAADAAAAAPLPSYPLIRCALPGWDNDARRQGHGMVLHGATPARYEAWLATLIGQARQFPFFGTPVVCINAWNEWAEGAYLEPDQHFGAAFLNATRRALTACGQQADVILLVGHDAFPAGAQLLLLHLAQALIAAHGARVEIALCGGGALEPDYRALAPLHLAPDAATFEALVSRLRARGMRHSLVNSAAASRCCAPLHAAGFSTTLLVHEMPGLIADRGLIETLQAAVAQVRHVVFASQAVRRAVGRIVRLPRRCTILPQGVYRDLHASADAVAAIRAEFGVRPGQTMALAMGYADRRKGFDYFLEVFARSAADVHCVWVGAFDPANAASTAGAIAAAEATGRFHRTFWREDVGALLRAADVFLLTSREDPYPSAALEALSVGRPVLAFAGGSGLPAALVRTVPMGDCEAMARKLRRPMPQPPLVFDFGTYVAELLRLVHGGPSVAVLVTCYRQAALIGRRLSSIFAQTIPVAQITVWDDASDDGSAEATRQAATAAGRIIRVNEAARNSGSPFGHWRAAVMAAPEDLVWIAEADDVAEPALLATLAACFNDPAVTIAFCDSRPVDPALSPRAENYQASYEAAGGAGVLDKDGVYAGRTFLARFLAERNILFNVSAVLWRRAALLGALDRLAEELPRWRVAGDWRLYMEVLAQPGAKIAHAAQPLNLHCRDAASASAQVTPLRHLAEIRRMHALLRQALGDPPGLASRQRAYLRHAQAYLSKP